MILFTCIGAINAASDNITLNQEIPDADNYIHFPTENVSNEDTNDSDMNHSNVKTFTDLSNLINDAEEGSVLNLTEGYKYDSDSDELFYEGIKISKNLTIVGQNNSYIDGNYLARCLHVDKNCSVTLKNLVIKNGYVETIDGGAILADTNSNISIENCTFHGNKAYNSNGGAIYGCNGTYIMIYNSEFYNNTGSRVSKKQWSEFKKGMGSAICMKIGTVLKLYDSVFRDNIGYLTTILIVTWDDVNTNQSILYVENCLFENNTARTNSVIYLDEFGIAEIINSVFKNNVATYYGGIVALDTSNSTLVKNCTFENNSAINGGGIYINSYDSNYRSNVKIIDSTFTQNTANEHGGAVFSKYGVLEIDNCTFSNNEAYTSGGAVYTHIGLINITNSNFIENSASYGGGLVLKTDENNVTESSFVQNNATVCGGAVYSTMQNVVSTGCIYSNNSAPKGSTVYGAFHAKITKYVAISGYVKLKIIITSLWGMPISNQLLKVKINGYTSGWLKTDSNGKVIFTVPKNKIVTNKTLSITMEQGVCFVTSYLYKYSAKITVPKTVKKSSKLKVTIINKKNNKPFNNTKFKIKVYTGKKYKTFYLKTNSKGVLKVKMDTFKKGNHKIHVYLNTNSNYISKKISFKIK